MLLVVSSDPDWLEEASTRLRHGSDRSVVAASNVAVALSVLETNSVDTVMCERHDAAEPLFRAIESRFPGIRCLRMPDAPDWEAFVHEAADREDEPPIDSGIIAYGLEDLLGLLSMTRKSADLHVTANSNRGRLCVRDGHLVHAECGHLQGDLAAYRILSWRDSRVKSIRPQAHTFPHSVHLAITTAVHESARRADEMRRLASRADVAAVAERLAGFPTFTAAVVADVDNRIALVERGAIDQRRRRKLWHGASSVGDVDVSAGGGAWWWDDALVVAAPVAGQYVLAASSYDPGVLASFAPVVVEAAKATAEIVEAIGDAGFATNVDALTW